MSFVLRLFALLGIILLVYIIWPRDTSNKKFDPEKTAKLEATAWDALREGNLIKASGNYYWKFDRQFHLPPLHALRFANGYTSAIHGFLSSPDTLDKESHIPKLVEVYVTMQRESGEPYDGPAVARAEALVWILVSEKADEKQVADAVARQLNLLYQIPSSQLRQASQFRALAFQEAFHPAPEFVESSRVESHLADYWKELWRHLPKKEASE